MVAALNWHHIRIRFAPQLSLRTSDGLHIAVCCNRPSLPTTNVNELGAAIARSIQLHHLSIPMESGVQQVDRLQVLVLMVPDIGPARNWFATAGIIPDLTWNEEIRIALIIRFNDFG